MAVTACRKCGLRIKFEPRMYSGIEKLTPVNVDGSDHWPTCRENRLPPQPLEAAPQCDCAQDTAELRRCSANNGVLWQCRRCGAKLSKWLSRAKLGGVDVDALPEYVR
jgi:ribosomal protein L40E